MSLPWAAAVVGLWIFVLFQALLLFFLYRQFGVTLLGRYEAISRDGPPLASVVPSVAFVTARGTPHDPLSGLSSEFILLAFLSRHCQFCSALAPHLNRMARKYSGVVDVYAVIEEPPDAAAMTLRDLELKVEGLTSRGAFESYRVRVTPFVIIVDGGGSVRAKGLANTISGLERLLREAQEINSGDSRAKAGIVGHTVRTGPGLGQSESSWRR